MIHGIMDDLATQWNNVVAKFKAQEAAFRSAMNDLANNKAKFYAAGLGEKYEALFSKGKLLDNTINGALNTVASVRTFLKDNFGLGALPIALPFAAIAGVSAAIGAFILSYQALRRALDEWTISKLPPEQQAAARNELLNRANPNPFTSDIKTTTIAIAVIAALVVFAPKIFKGSR